MQRTQFAVAIALFCAGAFAPTPTEYDFDSLSFTADVWIGNKIVFHNPIDVDVEFITADPFEWIIADSQGNIVRTVKHPNAHGGWTSIDLPSLGLYKDYSIGFRNDGSSGQQIKQGEVRCHSSCT